MSTLKHWQQLWLTSIDYMFILLAEADTPESWDEHHDFSNDLHN